MSLLINLPESMKPQILKSALLQLEPDLEIIIGHENVYKKNEVEFIILWKNYPWGFLLNFPNLKAISSYGHGVDGIIVPGELPNGVPILRLADSTMAKRMGEYLLAVVLFHKRQLLYYTHNPDSTEWGSEVSIDGNQIGILGLGFLGQAASKVFLKM